MLFTVKIIISLILVYAVSMTVIYFIQRRLIFLPVKLKKNYSFKFNQNFEEININTADGIIINSLLFKSSEPSKGLIIYFHGNAGNLQRWGKYSSNFTALGYDILMPDYRSYGKSTGIPSEKALYDDAESIWIWVTKTYKYKKHIIYGRSLGAAVAASLASSANPDLLILETPFDKLNDATPSYLIPFKLKCDFDNTQHLKNVSCKKVIFHGTTDLLIPLSSAKKLKPFLKENDKMIIIKKGRHKNLDSFPEYHDELAVALQ